MARRPQGAPPAYRLHKSRNLAVVTLHGKDHYLGPYGSPESRLRYAELIGQTSTPRSTEISPPTITHKAITPKPIVTVAELTLGYWEHANQYYRRNEESPGRLPVVKAALRAINTHYAALPAAKFGPLRLDRVRQNLIAADKSRRYINDLMAIVVNAFRWAASKEMVRFRTFQALTTLAPLKRHRSTAREPKKVKPVDVAIVDRTLAHLSPTLSAMVRLQLLTGARPGEIRNLRPGEVEKRSDGIWCYRPSRHKNLERGLDRRIFLGPQARQILEPFLQRADDEYCFSPRDTIAWTREQRRANSKTPRRSVIQQVALVSPHIGLRYKKDAYSRAIARICKRFGIPPWQPNQLRHTRGTELRRLGDLETAKVVLGHTDFSTTSIYAERDFEAAARCMEQFG